MRRDVRMGDISGKEISKYDDTISVERNAENRVLTSALVIIVHSNSPGRAHDETSDSDGTIDAGFFAFKLCHSHWRAAVTGGIRHQGQTRRNRPEGRAYDHQPSF